MSVRCPKCGADLVFDVLWYYCPACRDQDPPPVMPDDHDEFCLCIYCAAIYRELEARRRAP